MYDTILVPVDGSEPSTAAIEHARNLAQHEGATVHVIHAIEMRSPGVTMGRVPTDVMTDVQEEAEQLVNDATDTLEAAGIDTRSEVVDGTASEAIPEYASEHDIDLIVMGTHGQAGLDERFLGSVTERVVRTSDLPVLTVSDGAVEE